jgi:ABC-type lipoprotein release transport system permease subunit
MSSLVFETPVADPVTFAVSALAFLMVALMATYIPARRAMGVHPATALRG